MQSEVMITFWKIIAVMILVLVNAFFVAAEFAIVKIRDTQLTPLIRRGHRRARMAQAVLGHLDRYLSAAQLGITLASLGIGWLGEPLFADLLQPVMQALNIESERARHTFAFVVGLSALTFVHIVVGEQAPKWMAIQKPLPTSLWVAMPLALFYKATYPFIWLLNQSSLWLLRRIGIEPASETELAHSEEELRLLFASQGHHEVAGLGRNIVLNALDLRNRVAREVMRPRQEIVALDTEASLAECIDIVEKTRFSRFPLCERGNLDKTIGVVHIKDIYALRYRAKGGSDLIPVARKMIYIPETARLEKLLHLLLDRRLHMAIVVDEYGGTVGLITLENVLEELVGQIQDEFDQEKPLLTRKDAQTWELLGGFPLHDLAELLKEPIEEEGLSTTSGWVTHKLGGFPKVGDVLNVGNYELQVEELDGPRVARLTLRQKASPPAMSMHS